MGHWYSGTVVDPGSPTVSNQYLLGLDYRHLVWGLDLSASIVLFHLNEKRYDGPRLHSVMFSGINNTDRISTLESSRGLFLNRTSFGAHANIDQMLWGL